MNREPHFDENEVLRQCMSPLNEEVPDMPENFHAQWTALVKEDAMKQEETRKVAPMRRWTRILSVAAALVFEAFVLLAETPLYGLWTGIITALIILYNFSGVWAMARILLPKILGRRGKALVAVVDGWAAKK